MMQVGMQLVYCIYAVIMAATQRLTVRCDCRPWQQEQQMGSCTQVEAGGDPKVYFVGASSGQVRQPAAMDFAPESCIQQTQLHTSPKKYKSSRQSYKTTGSHEQSQYYS